MANKSGRKTKRVKQEQPAKAPQKYVAYHYSVKFQGAMGFLSFASGIVILPKRVETEADYISLLDTIGGEIKRDRNQYAITSLSLL